MHLAEAPQELLFDILFDQNLPLTPPQINGEQL